MGTFRGPRACLALALLALAAQSSQARAGAAIASDLTIDPATGMTGAPIKPNGSGVTVTYRIEGTMAPGNAIEVVVSFEGVKDVASVRFVADDGLVIPVEGSGPRALAPGQSTTLTLQVVAGGEGIGYLHVFTTQGGATSVTSIPVRVGKAKPTLRSMGELKTDSSGGEIILIPVK